MEVVDPADCIPTALVLEDSPTIEIADQKPRINLLLPPSSSRITTAISGLFTWLREWRLARTWASVGFIGVLVGWVVFKRCFYLSFHDWHETRPFFSVLLCRFGTLMMPTQHSSSLKRICSLLSALYSLCVSFAVDLLSSSLSSYNIRYHGQFE